MWAYVRRNVVAIFRIYAGYEPLKVFTLLAGGPARARASLAWSRFLWDWIVHGDRVGHLQSIILGGVLLVAAVQVFALGVIADLIAAHRIVSQRTLERVRRIELELGVEPSHYHHGLGRPGEPDEAAGRRGSGLEEGARAAAAPRRWRGPARRRPRPARARHSSRTAASVRSRSRSVSVTSLHIHAVLWVTRSSASAGAGAARGRPRSGPRARARPCR